MKKLLIAATVLLTAITLVARPAQAFDPRAVKMRQVLQDYNSPMVGIEEELIILAEKYGFDWTLLAAIAGTESSFGNRMPAGCTNPYGWGIYGSNRLCFDSFVDAASAVAEGLGTRYNATSVETIGRTYNKVSTASWISHTRFFMNKIKDADIPVSELPITL